MFANREPQEGSRAQVRLKICEGLRLRGAGGMQKEKTNHEGAAEREEGARTKRGYYRSSSNRKTSAGSTGRALLYTLTHKHMRVG